MKNRDRRDPHPAVAVETPFTINAALGEPIGMKFENLTPEEAARLAEAADAAGFHVKYRPN